MISSPGGLAQSDFETVLANAANIACTYYPNFKERYEEMQRILDMIAADNLQPKALDTTPADQVRNAYDHLHLALTSPTLAEALLHHERSKRHFLIGIRRSLAISIDALQNYCARYLVEVKEILGEDTTNMRFQLGTITSNKERNLPDWTFTVIETQPGIQKDMADLAIIIRHFQIAEEKYLEFYRGLRETFTLSAPFPRGLNRLYLRARRAFLKNMGALSVRIIGGLIVLAIGWLLGHYLPPR